MHPDDGPLPIDYYAAGRWTAYLAALLLIGVACFAFLEPRWRDRESDQLGTRAAPRATWTAIGALLLLLISHLVRLIGQAQSFLDPDEPLTGEFIRSMATTTTWGKAWLLQVAATLISLVIAAHATLDTGLRRQLLWLPALGVAFTLPLTGHALEHPWGATAGVTLHALHLLGGGLWLGTLGTIGIAALPVGRDPGALARLVRAFSPVALAGAATATTAGVLLAAAYVGSFAAVPGTRYGRTLLVKVGLLALVAAAGAYNWKRVSPTLGTDAGTRRLRRSATLELGLGLLLLGAAAVLVALPAPTL